MGAPAAPETPAAAARPAVRFADEACDGGGGAAIEEGTWVPLPPAPTPAGRAHAALSDGEKSPAGSASSVLKTPPASAAATPSVAGTEAATPYTPETPGSAFALGNLLAALEDTPESDARARAASPCEGEAVCTPPPPPSDVGLAYDTGMEMHEGGRRHPERPARLSALATRLAEDGLSGRMAHVSARVATDAELLLCHSAEHLEKVGGWYADMDDKHGPEDKDDGPAESVGSRSGGSGTSGGGGATSSSSSSSSEDEDDFCLVASKARYDYGPVNGLRFYSDMVDTFFNAHTDTAARMAAGSVTECALRVCRRELRSAAAVVRPPGHHAECARAMGFCYYNNTAIAARAAIAEGLARRVLIVDWDVHHGNGIQNILYESADVMYVSLHRYGDGFYPGTGAAEETGKGAGAGFNLNVPWDRAGMHDVDYIAALDLVVLPVAQSFDPDLVILAAGFDAAAGDPLGGCELTPAGYAAMTRRFMSLARGKLVLALEGGYNTEVTSECFAACVGAMLDGEAEPASSGVPKGLRLRKNTHTAKLLWELSRTLAPHWEVLQGDDYEARYTTYFKGGGAPLVRGDPGCATPASVTRRSARARTPSARAAAGRTA